MPISAIAYVVVCDRVCAGVQLNEAGEEWVDAVDDIMEHFMQDTGRAAVFTVCFT